MGFSDETYAAAKKYTDDTVAGAGGLAGVPCQIQSITAITGGNRVTFLWVDNNGVEHTSTMNVMDGIDGEDGKGIQSVSVNAENHLIITYTDGTTADAGQIEIHSAVDSVNGQTGAVVIDAEDVGALPDDTPIPSKTSDLTNDSGFITKVVNDLVNYYLKSETYSKTEVDAIITAVKNSRMEVVATLPTTDIKTNVIYLVPKDPTQTSNVKDEYINLDGTSAGWEKIGDTEIDLSDYVTTQALNTALAAYTTTVDLTTLLAAKADKSTVDGILDGTNIDSFADVETALTDYQTKNLTTPITVDGVQKTTVEDTLSALNEFGEDERDMRYLYNCKNLLSAMTSPHTSRDVVFTPNDKGEITCSGSVSTTPAYIPAMPIDQSALVVGEKYILSGLPDDSTNCYIKIYESSGYVEISGGTKARMITYDGTNIKSWDCGVRTVGTDATGRVFKPMLCLKSDYDNDPTYVPSANTNQYLSAKKADWSAVNALYNDVSGTKNILESVGANSTTIRGVLFTKNSDGSVTASGTQDGAGGGSYYHVNDYIYGDGKKYILTGCPEGGSRTTYRIYLYDNTTGSTGEVATDSGSGSIATLISGHTYICNIHIGPSQTVSDLTFHPMLRLASIQDDTYVPYAMTNQQITPYVQAISNPNLLDNPWFTVNQRGNTFYQTENGYCVDRWILGKGAFTARETNAPYGVLQTRVANTNGWLRQKTEFELDTTKPITYSAIISASVTSDYGFALKFSNMDDYSDSKMKWFPTTANQKVLVHFTDLPFKNTAFEVVANAGASSTVKIYALKAELGSVSTLAMDTAPNYATELLKCQRYFVRYAGAGYPEICHAVESSSTSAWGLCFLPVPMRTKPSVTFANVNAYRLSDDSATAITAMAIHALANNACKIMFTLASNGQNGAVVEIQPNSNSNGYVDFSADL